MPEDRGFEPYIDWDAITDEMTDDLHKKVVEYKEAQDNFLAQKSKENASRLMRLQWELSRLGTAITHTIFTVPMMVHVAGPKAQSTKEDHTEEIIQRCKRCGSVLQIWQDKFLIPTPEGLQPVDPDQMPWWNEGDIVAKASDESGSTMYEIEEGRDLDPHERPCPDLARELS